MVKTLCIALVVVAGFLAFMNCLDNGFIRDWDDNWLVMDNGYIRTPSIQNIKTILNPFMDRFNLGAEFLPVRDLSYMFDQVVWGAGPVGFHVTNVLFHILSSIILFLLLSHYFPGWRAPLFGALLFALHPIHTESVTWIASRKDVLAMFFALLSYHAYLKRLDKEGFARTLMTVLGLAFYAMAVLSKATAITLPAFIVLGEFFLGGKRSSIIRQVAFHAALMVPLLVLAVFVAKQNGVARQEYYGGSMFATTLSMGKVFVEYLKVTFWPVNLDIPRDPVQYITKSLDLRSMLGMAAAAAMAGFALWRFRAELAAKEAGGIFVRSAAFASAWFLVALAPVSNLLITGQELMAERYMYFPSISLSLVAAGGAAYAEAVLSNKARRLWGLTAVAAVLLCAFGLLTADRNRDWKDSETLWKSSISHNPTNGKAVSKLANYYMMMAEIGERLTSAEKAVYRQKAIEKYELALELNPAQIDSLNNLGIHYTNTGEYARAEEYFQTAISIDPGYTHAWANLATLRFHVGMNEKALEAALRSVELAPKNVSYRINVVNYYMYAGDYGKAEEELLRILDLDPRESSAHMMLGDVFFLQDMFDSAEEQYKEALELSLVRSAYWVKLGKLYAHRASRGEAKFGQQAVKAFEKAVEYDQFNPQTRHDLGTMLAKFTKDYRRAAEEFNKALSYDPDFTLAKISYAGVLVMMGQFKVAESYLDSAMRDPSGEYYYFALKTRARMKAFSGDPAGAERIYQAILADMPDDFECLKAIGDIKLSQGQNDMAAQYYLEARKYAPSPQISAELEKLAAEATGGKR